MRSVKGRETCFQGQATAFVVLDLRQAEPPPSNFSFAKALNESGMTYAFSSPAGVIIVFRPIAITPAPFTAREIILPNALRGKRGRLTPRANIPPEVIDVLAKDVNLIHLLAACRQRQLDRHLERVERFKKWRWSA